MNDTRDNLLAIGAFADAAQLSLRALRLYAELGILTPSHVDPVSGYRYYHAMQLQRARLIRLLRRIEMPLATIRRVLAARRWASSTARSTTRRTARSRSACRCGA